MSGADNGAPLRVEGLSLLTSRDILLDRLSFAIEPGEVLALSGAAGAGKTLLLRALAGLAPKGITVLGDIQIRGRRLLVTQDGALDPLRPLGAQFADLLARQSGMDERAALRCAAEALERFQVPAAARRLALHPHELGEAMRWRAALALAMAAQPALLLADAPAAALDPTQRVRLLSDLASWTREAGTALLLAGRPQPDPIQADPVHSGLADRRLILAQGRLEAPEEEPNPAPSLVEPAPSGPPILSVRDLRVAFPLGRSWRGEERWLTVVDGLSIALAEGETLALLGETGSGKSVLARAILRLIPPVGGQVSWLGTDLAAAPPEAMRWARRDLQILFPDPLAAFDPLMTIGAQLAETLESLRPTRSSADRAARLAETLGEVGLPAAVLDLHPGALRPAEAARAGLARALLPEPRLLVCDEPAAALDGAERADFLALLQALRRRRRLALLYATQDAAEGLRIARRALVLLLGRIVESADSAVLAAGARHPYSRALIAAAGLARPALHGDPPSPLRPPTGCALRLRCPLAHDGCAQVPPTLDPVAPGHRVACHVAQDEAQDGTQAGGKAP
ncbi:peptide/nickel transport system ATP-binding protein [Azospirillum baldaniorum]|uniref:oligopeptide/dipeptide ABC transporter ATP-binding protein n=1 Tax=Azospirillum baldaniorum TaxID=1064539 RepID=UPI00119E49C7|nr:oligopeptide/dipeptide ABC transporter ATP-binding protein [Azospirillum baldaniorum]TWA68711.1 peptide/nickel transport system ATP-binding protein [Azospirillum baldaniorum]